MEAPVVADLFSADRPATNGTLDGQHEQGAGELAALADKHLRWWLARLLGDRRRA